MTTRLAALIALPLVMTACAVENDPLDDLPSYAGDSGGGKGDDPNCTDASYRAFIKSYMRDEATPETNPCMAGNDASYRIWAYLVKQQIQPMLDRYSEVIDSRRTGGSVDGLEAAGTLDDTTRSTLAKLALVRPPRAGKVGMGAWVEYLYLPTIQTATLTIGTLIGGYPFDQKPREITTYEDEWLTYVEQSRPAANASGGWAVWWQGAVDSFEDVRNDVFASAEQQVIDTAWLARLAKAAPPSQFDADGAIFQQEITSKVADEMSALTPKTTFWQQAIALKPPGGGPVSYKTWAEQFANVAQFFNDNTPSVAKGALMDTLVAARPCASGPDVELLATKLHTALLPAGNDSAGRALADDVVPVACEP